MLTQDMIHLLTLHLNVIYPVVDLIVTTHLDVEFLRLLAFSDELFLCLSNKVVDSVEPEGHRARIADEIPARLIEAPGDARIIERIEEDFANFNFRQRKRKKHADVVVNLIGPMFLFGPR